VADGVGGLLVEGHEPSDYAERILRVLGDPGLAARLSAGALAHAARFSWDATAADVRDVYLELAGRPAGCHSSRNASCGASPRKRS